MGVDKTRRKESSSSSSSSCSTRCIDTCLASVQETVTKRRASSSTENQEASREKSVHTSFMLKSPLLFCSIFLSGDSRLESSCLSRKEWFSKTSGNLTKKFHCISTALICLLNLCLTKIDGLGVTRDPLFAMFSFSTNHLMQMKDVSSCERRFLFSLTMLYLFPLYSSVSWRESCVHWRDEWAIRSYRLLFLLSHWSKHRRRIAWFFNDFPITKLEMQAWNFLVCYHSSIPSLSFILWEKKYFR